MLQGLDHALLRIGNRGGYITQCITEKPQGPGRGDGIIELTQRPGRGIARIGKNFSACFLLPLIQVQEILLAHIDFGRAPPAHPAYRPVFFAEYRQWCG